MSNYPAIFAARSFSASIRDRNLQAAPHMGRLYEEVKLEWSMCLQPETWQKAYDALIRDYEKLLAGEDMGYADLYLRSCTLIERIHHVNKSVIEYNRMHTEKREWFRNLIINGHVQVFGAVNGIRSLKHLESKVAQISGVIRTRVDTPRVQRPCLTIFVFLNMAPASYKQMISVVDAHIGAENAGFSLVERQFADRYDFVDISDSPVVSSPRFDVDRYDSLDLSKSTVFQRFRRRRKHRISKPTMFQRFRRQRKHRKSMPPDVNTIRGRLKMVFRAGKAVTHWLRTGETPDVLP